MPNGCQHERRLLVVEKSLGLRRIIGRSRRETVRNEKNKRRAWGLWNSGRKDQEEETPVVWTCGTDGGGKTTNRGFTRTRRGKEKQTEDLHGQCQGRPEREKHRLLSGIVGKNIDLTRIGEATRSRGLEESYKSLIVSWWRSEKRRMGVSQLLTHKHRVFIRVEWTNKKLNDWNPTPTKSCLMVGTQKIVKTFQKYYCLLPSTKSQNLKKYDFLIKVLVLLLQFLYMQLLDCYAIYHWKGLFKRKRNTYYLSKYVFIWWSNNFTK